jgi:hypothetical protein
MKITRRIVLLFAIISLLISLSVINETYAKYANSVSGQTNINVARWHILVNNQDIKNNSSTSQILTPTFTGTEHIAENVIAPTSEGYIDIIIDSSNVDVSFSYSITPNVSENSAVSDFLVTGYTLNNGELTELNNNESISNNIYKTDNIATTSIRLFVKWNDDENASMNNEADTNASLTDGQAKMKVTINFTQIAN